MKCKWNTVDEVCGALQLYNWLSGDSSYTGFMH